MGISVVGQTTHENEVIWSNTALAVNILIKLLLYIYNSSN